MNVSRIVALTAVIGCSVAVFAQGARRDGGADDSDGEAECAPPIAHDIECITKSGSDRSRCRSLQRGGQQTDQGPISVDWQQGELTIKCTTPNQVDGTGGAIYGTDTLRR